MEAMTDRRLAAGSGPLTVSDLEGMPDDGRRYELIDGTLVVSPAPGTRHQIVVGELFALLRAACPPGLAVIIAPFAVRLGETVELQPDLLVGRVADFTERDLRVPPLLVVEVLSPSTALHDLNTKKALYQRLGVPNYWIVDPIALSLAAYALDARSFRETATVTETFTAHQPFPVRIRLADLLGQFR